MKGQHFECGGMTNGFSLLLCSGISVEVETLISGQNKESRRIMDRLRGRRLFVGFHRVICCNDLKLCSKDGAGQSGQASCTPVVYAHYYRQIIIAASLRSASTFQFSEDSRQ